ncbi:hypothetical protein [Halobacterium sp. KA-6]|uniref:hypothetical protein n=1 Tax=Halobacterium sp. KA-6 TaxID=2896368 RepID=UPI001E41A41A|nr:hypothetical protein [Halobacterium sp. KA-6]MCD2205293.1 hypothetical protein [Halobacterium sp. KA-6]
MGLEKSDLSWGADLSSTNSSSLSSINTEAIDFEKMAEAAQALLFSYYYNRAEDNEKVATILQIEHSIQEEYLDEGLYKPAIIRQATFIEYLLLGHLVTRFEEEKGSELSNSEMNFLQHSLGNSGRHTLISMFGILSEEEEQAVSELLSARNDIAHSPWIFFEEDSEERFERIAERIHTIFEQMASDEKTLEKVSETLIEEFDK